MSYCRFSLYQGIKRARQLNTNKIYLGFTASIEKQRLGAKVIPSVAYMQAKDHYNMEVLGLFMALL